jgi:hypothetical protein
MSQLSSPSVGLSRLPVASRLADPTRLLSGTSKFFGAGIFQSNALKMLEESVI